MAVMRPPKVREARVPGVSLPELKAILSACEGTKFEERRDMALAKMYYTTGARRAEVAELRISHGPGENDLDMGYARVRGKWRGRDRLVPLDARTVKVLDRYPHARSHHPCRTADRVAPVSGLSVSDSPGRSGGLPHRAPAVGWGTPSEPQ